MYEALLAGHILCAVLWVGNAVTLHVLGRRALAYIVWVVSGVFGTVVYPAMIKRALEVGPGSEEGLERVRRVLTSTRSRSRLLLVVVDMATKPGL